MSDEDAKTLALPDGSCPRCGGAPAPSRKVSRLNPFLPNPKTATCSDCGLTYTTSTKPAKPGS